MSANLDVTLSKKPMNVIIIAIDHYLQLLESESDTMPLRASKTRLREILETQLRAGNVTRVFEESSPNKESIAARLAYLRDPRIPWDNIHMTEAERKAAGIYEALLNRPGSPDDAMEYTIEHRIPEDEVREEYFTSRILAETRPDSTVLVLIGDMHVLPIADRLRASGHTVEILSELVPVKRWR